MVTGFNEEGTGLDDRRLINERIRRCKGSSDPLDCLRKLFEDVQDGNIAREIGRQLQSRGDLVGAAEWYRSAEELYPEPYWKGVARRAADSVAAALGGGPENDPTVGRKVKNYRIEGLLGEGGFGVVYRARDEMLDRPAALKEIPRRRFSPEEERRFLREVRAAAQIDHPNVVGVYAAWEERSAFYVAMKLVEGGSLEDLLLSGGPLPPARLARIVVDVARGLEAAHSRGFVHRDLKPSNILLEDAEGDGRALVSDFGLVTSPGASTLTGTGFLGTVAFAAPEQVGGGSVDGRADLYSLGLTAFYSLTGVLPFERDNTIAFLYARVTEAPPRLTDVLPAAPHILEELLLRSMATKPEERFQSAAEMRLAWEGVAPRLEEESRDPHSVSEPRDLSGWLRMPERDAPEFVRSRPQGEEFFEGLRVWQAPESQGGHLYGVARTCKMNEAFGRPRRSFGVFLLDGARRADPLVARFGEDDVGGFVSLVRGRGGRPRDVFASGDELPQGYGAMQIAVHRDRVVGGYAKLAVVARLGDDLTMVQHGALQARLRKIVDGT